MPIPTSLDPYLKEIDARVGGVYRADGTVNPNFTSTMGFNLKLPTGEMVYGNNPNEAATILLGGGGVQDRGGTPNSSPTPGVAPIAPTIPTANFPSGVPAPYQTTTGAAKPIPNSGSDTVQGVINGKIQTFTSQEAAQAAGALNIQPVSSSGGTPPTPPGTVGSTGDLLGNASIKAFQDKLTEMSSQISAGIASGGATKILDEMFTKFGVQEAQDSLAKYNQIIYDQEKVIKDLPEAIKNTLANVGVSENQLTRLVAKDSFKPIEALNDTMKLAGAAQDRINQSLNFVKMFTDAAMQDQAARIEALKFDFETNKFMLDRMDDKQKMLINLALDDQKNRLTLSNDLLAGGADPSIVRAVQNAGSYADAQAIAQPFYKQKADTERLKTAIAEIHSIISNYKGTDIKSLAPLIKQIGAQYNVSTDGIIAGLKDTSSNTYGFTSSQENVGANNASLPRDQFVKLEPEVQNFFVNIHETLLNAIRNSIEDVNAGKITAKEYNDSVDAFGFGTPVENYLKGIARPPVKKTTNENRGLIGDFLNWLNPAQ